MVKWCSPSPRCSNNCIFYNTRIGQIPEVFVASFMALKPRAFFKVSEEDRKLVEVKFQNAAGA